MIQLGLYNYSKLRGRIKEKNYTQETAACAIKMNPATLSQKLSGRRLFKQNEISALCDVLEIPPENIPTYFFAN